MSDQTLPVSNDDIKTMKLYTNVERIRDELASRGMTGDNIDPFELSKMDSMHYKENDAVNDAIEVMKLDESSNVLDVGSGFGGPARILSSLSKCTTVALELQPDIHELAEDLTRSCNLSKLVKHELGDILNHDLDSLGSGTASFDAVVSFLVFLHIPDKASLLDACAKMLKRNGYLFVEDYYCRSPFTASEVESLATDVFCKELPTREEYVDDLEAAGFHNIQFIDKSTEWTDFVTERLDKFIAKRESFVQVHGEPTYESLLLFYKAVVALFVGKNLGGVRIIAQKMGKDDVLALERYQEEEPRTLAKD